MQPDQDRHGADRSDMTTLLTQQHHEMMEALRSQDVKLNQLLASPSRRSSSIIEDVAVDGPFSSSSSHLLPALPQLEGAAVNNSPGSSSKSPQMFQSYTSHDLRLREDATEAHNKEETRKRVSVYHYGYSEEPKLSLVKRIAGSPAFDAFFAGVVLVNAIFIGIEVQFEVTNPDSTVESALRIFQYMFAGLFSLELLIRISAGGIRIFCSEDWFWSLLDLGIVLTSAWEIVVHIFEGQLEGAVGVSSLKALRIIRLTRVFKTAQVMRIFRFVIALRTLVRSIMHTLKALIWAMLLLTLIVYVFAVLFTQIVDGAEKDLGVDAPEMANSTRYFGSLPQTMLSLFMSITGGVSWEAVIEPLTFISPVWSLVFLFYISFIYFAVLNVVTGVFCQSAIESAQNDHLTVAQSLIDNKEAHVERLRTLFAELGAGDEAGITFYAFEEKMHDPAVREYFETLGINVYDAWSFFKLLDADGGGFVEPEEFFRGCLKFRGHARAIEVGKVLQDQQWLIRSQSKFQAYVEEELHALKGHIFALSEIFASRPLGRRKGSKETARSREL